MKSWCLETGYIENMIDDEMKEVKFSGKGSKKSNGSEGVPVVVTYHPFF